MSAVMPPIIFSKEVAQNRPPRPRPATSLTPKIFSSKFPGMGSDENLKLKSPPSPGAHVEVRRQDKMKSANIFEECCHGR